MDVRSPGSPATPATPPAPVEPAELRAFLGHFATGVTVVTYRRGEFLGGATVNAFTSVSLDPPLVLVSMDRRGRSAAHLTTGGYVINVLAEDQRDLAMHFAGKGDKDGGGGVNGPVPWLDAHTPAPRLAGTVGHVRCRPWRSYDGGDHVLCVGLVEEFELRGGRPLLFFGGSFRRVTEQQPGTAWSWSLDDPANIQQFAAAD